MFRTLFKLLLSVALSTALLSPVVIADTAELSRPKIGLALSGGGARGAAHVGVIRVLEEMQIPVDYIAGTSMGAIVGGLYASGMTSDEIAHQMATIDWDDVFEDDPDRPARSQRRKDDDFLYLAKGRLGVSKDGIQLPNAAVSGQKLDLILRALTLPVSNIDDFTQLPIPFNAVAMDIATGKEVVLSSGDLATSIRASMAIPAALAPIEINGQLLVDGGSANNLPISVVRDMGADIVIAVDISTPLSERKDLGSALSVVIQLTGLLIQRNVEQQISTLTEQDILIVPNLGTIGTGDFDRTLEAIDVGQTTAQTIQQQLAVLSTDKSKYNDYLLAHTAPDKVAPPTVKFVRFDNNSKLSEAVLRQHFDVQEGEVFDLAQVELGVQTIYGLELFEAVSYNIIKQDDGVGIEVAVKEKSWGTDNLQMGMELNSDLSDESSFNIGLAYTMMPLNSLNGEWRTSVQFGENSGIFTELYQPLDAAARYFTHASLAWKNEKIRLFSPDSDTPELEYDLDHWQANLLLGRNFDRWGSFSFGVHSVFAGNADLAVGSPDAPNFDFEDGFWSAQLRADTLDDLYFTRSGYFANLRWIEGEESLGAENDYQQAEMILTGAKSWDRDTLLLAASMGTTLSGDLSVNNAYRLGGFMRLSGLKIDELIGTDYGLLTASYQRYLYKSNYFPLYAGGAVQTGNVWLDKEDIGKDLILSGTAYIGADTPIGPLYLGYGLANGGRNAIYLFLGQPFR